MPNSLRKPTIDILKEVILFKAFDSKELELLAAMTEFQKYEEYSNIVIEGELTWGIFIIASGTVGIYKTSQNSSDTYDLAHLGEGSFFGEMSLIDENPRSATVRALTNCETYFISKENFTQFLRKSQPRMNRFYSQCVKTLVNRLRELNDSYVVSQYNLWKTFLDKDGKAA